MKQERVSAELPVDVGSRLESLWDLVGEVKKRVGPIPVLSDLLDDFQEMTREYILRFESSLQGKEERQPKEKWMRRHEMLDKLTREWHVIYSLASSTELGNTFLAKFQPYVEQAMDDIGVAYPRDNFLLIPIFGESFSLSTVRYSASNVAILKLPISVIHSPWELSVIWHEMAGLKVISIRDKIQPFIDAYAQAKGLKAPTHTGSTQDPIVELFRRIRDDGSLDDDLLGQVKQFLAGDDGPGFQPDEIWSRDWFEQLYKDACSVFAFGEGFVPVLDKILRRQARKLSADRRYPDLETRLTVARRLLALRKGNAAAPANPAERLTDKLLWAFIQETKSDSVACLPVAFASPDDLPEIRRQLSADMQDFNARFGDFSQGILETPVHLGAMDSFVKSANDVRTNQGATVDRPSLVKQKLQELFRDNDVNRLLETPFSPSDEMSFSEHGATDTWQSMYIGSSGHGGHTVLHYGH